MTTGSVSPARRAPSARSTPTQVGSTSLLLTLSAAGASPQSMRLEQHLRDINVHYTLPASNQPDPRRERFRLLAQQWRADTQWLSSASQAAMHPAYQAIIGMGADALPLILEDLRQNSGHWYWALKAISNQDPVVPADRGSIKKMRAAWLRWGEIKGLIQP